MACAIYNCIVPKQIAFGSKTETDKERERES